MVKVYSKALDGHKHITAHFLVREFACRDGADVVLVHPMLAYILESLRVHYGRPITIHSGYRTESYNRQIGGATHSQHCRGYAADISVRGFQPSEVASYVRHLMPDFGGVGRYKTFTHIDVRPQKADWNG